LKVRGEELAEDQEIYSYHSFMLPFSFNVANRVDILKNWTQKEYEVSYPQERYFHQFFKDSMFKDTSYFEYETYKDKDLTIKKSKEYNLTIESVNLRLFEINIGILTINIKNTKYEDLPSILEINDFIRRLYPECYSYNKDEDCSLLKFKIDSEDENMLFNKDDQNFDISNLVQQFLPTNKIVPSVDDKMFVISFYKNEKISNNLKEEFTKNDDWYRYVFIDGGDKTVQNYPMQKKLLEDATYPRWQQYGTMYGMTRSSFVCLSSDDMPLEDMRSIYYNMFSLLIMIKATLLKFSNEISRIAKDIGKSDIREDVNKLYKSYIQFVNWFYFREITGKDQGIELYDMGMSIFNIQRDIKDLDEEIEELHNYIEIQTEKERNNEFDKLNKLGYVFLPGTFIAGLFGMNTIYGIDNMFGFVFSIGIIIYSTLYLSKLNKIDIKEFFTKNR